MGAGHQHGPVETPRDARRYILGFLMPLIAATVIGLVLLWPHGETPSYSTSPTVPAEVTSVGPCSPPTDECISAIAVITDGEDAGQETSWDLTAGEGAPVLEPGTAVMLNVTDDGVGGQVYGFSDIQRSQPLLILAVLFSVAVILISRMKGVAALAGLAVSIGLLAWFVLPALLLGTSPVAVSAVGAAAIAIPSMMLAHGFNMRTSVALIGTIFALLVTLVLGVVFTGATKFTGMNSEDTWNLINSGMNLSFDLKGLFIAGLVIGTLGVLNDITITQSAAVWEVFRARPESSLRGLYSAGMRVGRDHVSATVNTLVLAYMGAALPLFLVIVMADAPLSKSLTNEVIAAEIVRSLVGGLGIIAAIPITTVLAAWVLTRGHHDDDEMDLRAAADSAKAAG